MVARRKPVVRRRRAPPRRKTKPQRARRANVSYLSTRGGATITDKLFTTMQYTDNITLVTVSGAPKPYQF